MAERNPVESLEKSSSSMTRFVCISDTHDNYDFTLPEGDILLHSGDFTQNGTEHEIETFFNWLKSLKQYRLKIFIVGNHESKRFYTKKRYKVFPEIIEKIRSNKKVLLEDGIIYLQDETYHDSLTGWRFYGSGWLSEHCKDPKEIRQHWSRIPLDTDILLTHGPPYSILDQSRRTPHLGCRELLNAVTTIVRPRLHLFGHVHGGHGQHSHAHEEGTTLFVNASLCDSKFRTAYPPVVIDLDKIRQDEENRE